MGHMIPIPTDRPVSDGDIATYMALGVLVLDREVIFAQYVDRHLTSA